MQPERETGPTVVLQQFQLRVCGGDVGLQVPGDGKPGSGLDQVVSRRVQRAEAIRIITGRIGGQNGVPGGKRAGVIVDSGSGTCPRLAGCPRVPGATHRTRRAVRSTGAKNTAAV